MIIGKPAAWRAGLVASLAALLWHAPIAGADDAAKPTLVKPGTAYRVPYQLTDTKHLLVRVKFNGKGPFNFIVDTGAPALFVATDAAKKAGIVAEKSGWGTINTVEIEGGVNLTDVKARIEDPFQLQGMNSMNLAGHHLDGMMGYTILAQFKMQLDLSKSHMVWTKLDWTPPTPVALGDGGQPPPELAAMGAMAGLLRFFVKERPNAVFVQRGFLGIELAEENEGVVIKSVVPASPAAVAQLRAGDRIAKFQGEEVKTIAELHKLVASDAGKKKLQLEVQRDGKAIEVEVATRKGL